MQIPQFSSQVGVVSSFATNAVEALEQAHLGKNRRYIQLRPGHFHGQVVSAQLENIQICREKLSVGMQLTAAPDEHFIPLGVILEGTGELRYCGREPTVTPLYHAAGGEWELNFKQPLDYIFLAFNKAAFFENVERLTLRPVPRNWLVSEARGIPPAALKALGLCFSQVLTMLQENSALLASPSVRRHLECGLLQRSVETLCLASPCTPSTNKRRARDLGVDRVLDYLRDCDHNTVPTMLDLCNVSGISERSLQTGFMQRFELSPMQYLRAYRLNGSRSDFAKANPTETTVARIANHWGFSELGRFAGDYRNLFGELPSQTLARI